MNWKVDGVQLSCIVLFLMGPPKQIASFFGSCAIYFHQNVDLLLHNWNKFQTYSESNGNRFIMMILSWKKGTTRSPI